MGLNIAGVDIVRSKKTKLVKGQENVTTPGTATHPGKSNPSGKAVGHSGKGNNGGGSGGGASDKGNIVYEKDIYYYHPDHLGSSTFISDADGELYQHLENFPFGETWVEESTNTQRTPYHFTAKELDEETGLYYFGGRYYDPRTSVWQSPDPILGDYLPSGDKEKDRELPGDGGVFSSYNMNLYGYVANNPYNNIDEFGFVKLSLNVSVSANWGAGVTGQLEVISYDFKEKKFNFLKPSLSPNIGVPNLSGGVSVILDEFLGETDFALSGSSPLIPFGLILPRANGVHNGIGLSFGWTASFSPIVITGEFPITEETSNECIPSNYVIGGNVYGEEPRCLTQKDVNNMYSNYDTSFNVLLNMP
ncbi:MAG: RHS repeat-associated core domain-containing protein [Candidatus Electrothrix sp. AW5]|nr:RHS repeat-associated core domain-containing protein [Candidatus Electrothrix gigas]